MDDFSEYIVYVDESGDHSMSTINQSYPMFVLAFCIFKKIDYIEHVVPRIQSLKFKYWGHDMVVFHEREIRKAEGDFKILFDDEIRKEFMADFNQLFDSAPFTLIACAIHKSRINDLHQVPPNPYHVALEAGLSKLYQFLEQQNQATLLTHVVLEQRGRKEDDELELEFRRICDDVNSRAIRLPFKGKFASKPANSCGMQLADLIARPIGRHLLKPTQPNRAYDILKSKIFGYSSLAAEGPNGLIYYE